MDRDEFNTGDINSERETIVGTLSKKSESSLKKYQQLFVGTDSIFDLLMYEFLTFFFAPMPGAIGFFLRKVFLKKLFSTVGNGTVIGPYVTLRCPKQISLGNTVLIDSNTVLDAKGSDSHIQLGNSVLIGKDSILSCTSARIVFGNDVSIGPSCHIRAGLCSVEMGSHVTIGSHSVVISGNPDHTLNEIPMKSRVGTTKGITIGNDVWIGVGVRIIDGVNIGNGCVIGAGAVVTENVPEYTIAAGVPARVVGSRNK